ncbi:MAG TPA: SPOR domain-containing protein [Blastocatellia bacterium]
MAPRSYAGRWLATQSSLPDSTTVSSDVGAAIPAPLRDFIEPPREDEYLPPFTALEEEPHADEARTVEYPALEIETGAADGHSIDSAPPSPMLDLGYSSEPEPVEARWLTAQDVASGAGESRLPEQIVAESQVAAREWPDQRFEFAREEEVTDAVEIPQPAAFVAVVVDQQRAEPQPVEAKSGGSAPEAFIAATDPWENPLPAWEFSQNEWPVMLAPKNQTDNKRRLLIIAAILLFIILAALYFFVIRPGADTLDPDDEAQVVNPPSAALPVSPQSQAPSAAVSAAARLGPQPESFRPQPATPSTGRYSLQASASPSQTEADEFATRLRQAGLPAFVVPADLGRRGIWYRVRIGGFENAQDALRFTGEAKERARASGLTLRNLNVVENDMP